MAMSNKKRRQILDALSAAAMEMLNEHCPAHKEGPPETWPEDEKKLWDVISEVEDRATKKIECVLAA